MENCVKVDSHPIPLRQYAWILAAIWTVVIVSSLSWNLRKQNQETLEMARTMARASYEKDILYRRWISGHGGVYVTASPQTPPNPHLRHMPERDLVTPGGRALTLVNPAYMTRQVYELAQQAGQAQGHITSLRPIRAENASDAWETASLKALEQGATEVSAIVDMKDVACLRLMRALITEQNCMPCHAWQGYKVGDIRGGISVAVPMAPLWAAQRKMQAVLGVGHGLLWLLGLAGIAWGKRLLGKNVRKREAAESAVRVAYQDLVKKQQRIEEDLKAAEQIQQSLLPQSCPFDEHLNAAWRFMPCDKIGGDFFNILPLDENHWAIYMVDVSGHGVPAAMVSVSISQVLGRHNHEIVPPEEILNFLDGEYPMERFDKFFTISYLVLDIRNGVIRYSNAGHPPPVLLRRDGSLELLEAGGTIIGIGRPIPFQEGESRLFSGDKLFIYTDGILEYQNSKGEFFGKERFHQCLQGLKEKGMSEMIDGIIDALMVFGDHVSPQDDLSILGLDFMTNRQP